MKNNDYKIEQIINLTKTVEHYEQILKPLTKSPGLKSNFFGDQKKELDSLHNQITFLQNETKKIKIKITFLFPLTELEELKNQISTKENKLAEQNKEIKILTDMINKQNDHIIFLEDSSSKQSVETVLNDKYHNIKNEYNLLSQEKLKIESEYRHLLKEGSYYEKRNKLLIQKESELQKSYNSLFNLESLYQKEEIALINDSTIALKQSEIKNLRETVAEEDNEYNKEISKLLKEYKKLLKDKQEENESNKLKSRIYSTSQSKYLHNSNGAKDKIRNNKISESKEKEPPAENNIKIRQFSYENSNKQYQQLQTLPNNNYNLKLSSVNVPDFNNIKISTATINIINDSTHLTANKPSPSILKIKKPPLSAKKEIVLKELSLTKGNSNFSINKSTISSLSKETLPNIKMNVINHNSSKLSFKENTSFSQDRNNNKSKSLVESRDE